MNNLDVNSLIIFIVFGATVLVLLAIIIRLGLRLKKAIALFVQRELDNGILQEQLLKIKSEKTLEQNESFVKFLSESRDWAFEYIENVQQAIGAVKTSASFGRVSEESLEELFALLPENNEEKQNE